jgi:hypothetical protein
LGWARCALCSGKVPSDTATFKCCDQSAKGPTGPTPNLASRDPAASAAPALQLTRSPYRWPRPGARNGRAPARDGPGVDRDSVGQSPHPSLSSPPCWKDLAQAWKGALYRQGSAIVRPLLGTGSTCCEGGGVGGRGGAPAGPDRARRGRGWGQRLSGPGRAVQDRVGTQGRWGGRDGVCGVCDVRDRDL